MPAVPISGNQNKVADVFIHGGMGSARGDSIAAVWNSGVEIIRNPYSGANSGVTALTAIML